MKKASLFKLFIVCQLSCVIYYYKIYLNKGCNKNGLNIDGNKYFLSDLIFLGMEDETVNYIQVKI